MHAAELHKNAASMHAHRANAQGQSGHGCPLAPSFLWHSQPATFRRFSSSQSQVTSVLANLSHELCRQLASLRAGLRLDPRGVTVADRRGSARASCDDGLALRRPASFHAKLSRLRGHRAGFSSALPGLFTRSAHLVQEIDRQFAPVACLTPNHVGMLIPLQSGIVGRHRRLTLPADLRESRIERPQVHSGGRAGSHLWASTRRFLAGYRLPIPDRASPFDRTSASSSPSSVCLATNARESRAADSGWPSATSW